MNLKKLHRNMCRDLEAKLEMDGDDDEEMVTRFARKFVHNGVKTRKPNDSVVTTPKVVHEEDAFEDDLILEVG